MTRLIMFIALEFQSAPSGWAGRYGLLIKTINQRRSVSIRSQRLGWEIPLFLYRLIQDLMFQSAPSGWAGRYETKPRLGLLGGVSIRSQRLGWEIQHQ